MKKQAQNINRGDFFHVGPRELVALRDARPTTNPALCEVLTMQTSNGNTGYMSFGPAEELEVAAYLTPAQTYAEELLAQLNELVVYCLDKDTSHAAVMASAKRGRALVDAIMPPAPVPVEELLAALVDMPNEGEPMTAEDAKRVAQIVDRAYRSGQLKRTGDSHADNQA